jgi:hypothetical protein
MNHTAQDTNLPAGYWKNAEGHLIPETMVKPIDKLRDQLVRDLVISAKDISDLLKRFKSTAFADVAAFVEASAEQYEVKVGGAKGNVTLTTYDGQYKVVRQYQEHLTFDEQLQAARQLINECIQGWSEGSKDELIVLVNDAFQVNKEGKINTGRVLGLRRHAIKDPKWQRAMQAISDSVRSTGSKPYIRLYERVGDTDEYRSISLDLAAV